MKKHFQNLTNLFKNTSSFEFKVQQSTLMSNTGSIDMADIIFVIECFEGYGPEENGAYPSGYDFVLKFFTLINKHPHPGLIAIKLNVTLHLILYEF